MNLKETSNNTNTNSNNYISNTTSTQQASSEKQSSSDRSHSSLTFFLNDSTDSSEPKAPKDSNNKTSTVDVNNNESSVASNDKTTHNLTNDAEINHANGQHRNITQAKYSPSSSSFTTTVERSSKSSIANEKEHKKSSSKVDKRKSVEPVTNGEKHSNETPQTQAVSEAEPRLDSLSVPASITTGPVSCKCKEHKGTETLNRIFDLSFNYLYDCMFNDTAFARKYRKYKKVHSLQVGEWAPSSLNGDQQTRRLDYKVDLGAIGTVKTVEEQKILFYKENECITLESETNTQGVLYTDYFSVVNRYCITRHTQHRTRLLLHTYVDYKKQPSFLVKGFIEKNAWNNLKEAFTFIQKELIKEVEPKTASSIENRFPLKLNFASDATPQIEIKPSKDQSNAIETKESRKSEQISSNTRKDRVREQRSEPNLTELGQPREALVVEEKEKEEERKEEEESENESQEQTAQHTTNKHIKLYNFVINQNTILHVIILFILIIAVLNVLLYMKLSNAERMVNTLSALKIKQNELHSSTSMCSNCNNDKKQVFQWRELISNSLNSIKTMNNLLKEWEDSLNIFNEQSSEF